MFDILSINTLVVWKETPSKQAISLYSSKKTPKDAGCIVACNIKHSLAIPIGKIGLCPFICQDRPYWTRKHWSCTYTTANTQRLRDLALLGSKIIGVAHWTFALAVQAIQHKFAQMVIKASFIFHFKTSSSPKPSITHPLKYSSSWRHITGGWELLYRENTQTQHDTFPRQTLQVRVWDSQSNRRNQVLGVQLLMVVEDLYISFIREHSWSVSLADPQTFWLHF